MAMLKMVVEIQGNRSKEGDLLAYDIALNIASNDLVIKNNDLILIDNAERGGTTSIDNASFLAG